MEAGRKPRYFEEALSDFTHDVASGRAIRHMVDMGYTISQIMQQLDYPTPRARVEQTVYRYMRESGMIVSELPGEIQKEKPVLVKSRKAEGLVKCLREQLEQNGEENSYVSCPFGMIYRDREARLQRMLAPLTTRERDYILGIAWEMRMMYHRLTSRMLEIGVQLALYSELEIRFYFLKSNVVVAMQDTEKTDQEKAVRRLFL